MLVASAWGAAPGDAGRGDRDKPLPEPTAENEVSNSQAPINQRFRSLDEYLANLERNERPVDGPWYKQVRPGVYELQTGNLRLDGPAPKRTFTREELERKFGFLK